MIGGTMNIEELPPKYQEQARAKLGVVNKESKYHAEKTEIDGIIFDSKKEAARYAELKQMEEAGLINDLVLQPRFLLQEPFMCDGKKERKIEYVADFEYQENGRYVVEDVKSPATRTQVYKLKRKLFLFRYGDQVDFREV